MKQHIDGDNHQALLVRDFNDKIAYAFQLATAQGPMCQEPMQGVAVFLEDLSVQSSAGDELDMGRLTGESIRLVREGITAGFLDWSPRIMLAMYSCEIQATSKCFPFYSYYSQLPHAITYIIRKLPQLTHHLHSSRGPRQGLRSSHPPPRPHPI
jgi:hypothetical protein